ncbi:energy transducer TonB [Dryocola sp. BD613]|uniref:energy transducer TonB n=1 Tax=Dryocola sp. BD613 TaxID=3133272 RepID=UPI003F4F68B5
MKYLKVAVISLAMAVAGCSMSGGGKGSDAGLSSSINSGKTPALHAGSLDSDAPDCNGEIVKFEQPLYPVSAAAQKKEGNVTVSFDVKRNGRPTNYYATGDEIFFQETWRAVRKSCWMPGTHREFNITFSLNYD